MKGYYMGKPLQIQSEYKFHNNDSNRRNSTKNTFQYNQLPYMLKSTLKNNMLLVHNAMPIAKATVFNF